MHVRKETVTITGSTGGAITGYTSVVNGGIAYIRYVKTDLSATSVVTITAENSSHAIFSMALGSASWSKAPRIILVNSTNGALANDYGYIPISEERIKVSVGATTSSTQTGKFVIYVEGN